MNITETKKVFLTPSGAATTDTLFSNLVYNIPLMFPKDPSLINNSVKVLHCEIPYSWYLINQYNDQLVLSTGAITLPHGSNYNANSFIAQLQSLLPSGMILSFNSLNGKFTLTYTSAFSILSTTTCYKLIGCAKNTTYASSSNVINLPFLCNFLGTKNLYINTTNIVLDNYNSATKTYSTLLCIAVSVSPYGIIF